MEVSWSVFKSFVDERLLSIQWVDFNNHYHLKAIDGPFELICKLYKEAPDLSEVTAFETVYKAAGNKSPKTDVITKQEKSDRVKRYLSFSATANKNATTSFMIKAPGNMTYTAGPKFQDNLTNDRIIYGGRIWGDNIVNGDYIKVDAVDHANGLGAGADYILKKFYEEDSISVYPSSEPNQVSQVNGIFLHPTEPTDLVSSVPATIYGGIWLRLTYVSVGIVNDPKIFVTINWDRRTA